MISLHLLRDEPEKISRLLLKKDPSFPVDRLIALDKESRDIGHQIEEIRKEKNELARTGKSGLTEEIRNRSIELGKKLKELEKLSSEKKIVFQELYLSAPNIPEDDIPEGNKESNKVEYVVGRKPIFDFPVKNHVELGELNGWLNFETAARIAGSQFALYKGEAVKLIYSLAMFMLKNNMRYGYSPILPPYLVNSKSLTVASNFPKFKDQVYGIVDEDLYLTPTAEVDLTNIYRDNIFSDEALPVRMTSWTSCFRKEAGGYGATERGLIRIHQFEKVELYTICEPEKSNDEQERMIECVEDILKKLGLTYRVVLLAAQDCSFASARTYDIEVWLPGQGEYYEVSSISNCTDFQARRGSIRYRKQGEKKNKLVYTLNGSSLALPRLMVALMETYQQSDGTIAIPDILKSEGIY